MGEFSLTHWLIVLIVVLLVFGPSRLPELGKSLGEGIRSFKKAIKEPQDNSSQQKIEKKPDIEV